MFKTSDAVTQYLVASDFDKTLSFNDSGLVLSEMMGVPDFEEKVAGLAKINLVQQGAELAYLLRHDPGFRGVRREHLIETGKQVRLKYNVPLLTQILGQQIANCRFQFHVISAGPTEVVRSALEGIVPPERVFGTDFDFDSSTGEISSVRRVPAGYGKVAVLQDLESRLHVSPDRTIYIGDGSSDLYVMQHVNSRDGHTIAVSEAKSIGRIAKRTVLSDHSPSVLVPILEDILKWDSAQIRQLFAAHGLTLQDWDKVRTDWLAFHDELEPPLAVEHRWLGAELKPVHLNGN
ncbi:HAD-IB family phosphatase [Prosthecobacter sp. SYSU 5D2]|uniref:HAD-IB family phosphatase n=1 Tax=Prosthecobacter sp. SYSU 5D2 TaxID=3134134 RepID=UPI0031FE7A48